MADILIIEDEEPLVKIYSIVLANAGHNIIGSFYDGKEALNFFKRLKKWPEIIIIDQRLPGMKGLDLLKVIKEDAEKNKSQILFISADNLVQNEVTSLGAKFIQKPFSVLKLSEIITNLLNPSPI